MEKWILFGAGFAMVLSIVVFGEGSPGFTCDAGQTQIQFCVKEGEFIDEVANLDSTLNEYFKTSFDNGDSTGFSLDKTLVLNLSAYLSLNRGISGIRLYPGQVGTSKYILIKPLNADGYERANEGAAIEVSDTNLDGPCPKWCGDPSRIITPP